MNTTKELKVLDLQELIQDCLRAEMAQQDVFLMISDLDVPTLCDYEGIVTFCCERNGFVTLQDQITGHCVRLSHTVHTHQGGIDWTILKTEEEKARALESIERWHNAMHQIVSEFHETALGVEHLQGLDSTHNQ